MGGSAVPGLPDPKVPLSEDALAGLSRQELVGLVLAQSALIENLQAELAALRSKVAELEAELATAKRELEQEIEQSRMQWTEERKLRES